MEVSVITTLFNYKKYIGEAIISFLGQNFLDSEMIIVDDGSRDNPYSVIKKFDNKRIKYIRLKKNRGYSHAKNVGIMSAKSEILVMLDADDMLTTNSISCRYNKIQKGYDFVHGPAIDLIDGKTSKSRLWEKWLKKPTYKHVHAQGVMLRKDIHRKIGLYDEKLRCKSDREMWARIFNYGFNIGTVSEFVSYYRIHKNQMSRSSQKLSENKKLQKTVLSLIEKRKTDLSGVRMLD